MRFNGKKRQEGDGRSGEGEGEGQSIGEMEMYFVFQASCAALTFLWAVSNVNGGKGGRAVVVRALIDSDFNAIEVTARALSKEGIVVEVWWLRCVCGLEQQEARKREPL